MRYVLILVPFAAGLAMMIGGFYAAQGGRLIAAGRASVGALFLVYGIGGVILGVALWRAHRQYRRRIGRPDSEESRR